MIITKINKINYYDVIYNTIRGKHRIAFYGQPDQKTIDILKEKNASFIDLDVNLNSPNYKKIPDTYCHIIRNIVNNAISLKNEIDYVLCTTGKDKCDQGRNVMELLDILGFKLIDASNLNTKPLRKPIISNASGNLKQRVIRIMELIYKPLSKKEEEYYLNRQCKAICNFHGTPPHDINILELFPNDTHIEGWTKLVEMGIPSQTELEWHSKGKENIPTVYFAQSFCNKQMLASILAENNNGLYIDAHGSATASTKAKIEAFISLKTKAVASRL